MEWPSPVIYRQLEAPLPSSSPSSMPSSAPSSARSQFIVPPASPNNDSSSAGAGFPDLCEASSGIHVAGWKMQRQSLIRAARSRLPQGRGRHVGAGSPGVVGAIHAGWEARHSGQDEYDRLAGRGGPHPVVVSARLDKEGGLQPTCLGSALSHRLAGVAQTRPLAIWEGLDLSSAAITGTADEGGDEAEIAGAAAATTADDTVKASTQGTVAGESKAGASDEGVPSSGVSKRLPQHMFKKGNRRVGKCRGGNSVGRGLLPVHYVDRHFDFKVPLHQLLQEGQLTVVVTQGGGRLIEVEEGGSCDSEILSLASSWVVTLSLAPPPPVGAGPREGQPPRDKHNAHCD